MYQLYVNALGNLRTRPPDPASAFAYLINGPPPAHTKEKKRLPPDFQARQLN